MALPNPPEGQEPITIFESNRLREWEHPSKRTWTSKYHVKAMEYIPERFVFRMRESPGLLPAGTPSPPREITGRRDPFFLSSESTRYKKGASKKRRRERQKSGLDAGPWEIKLGYSEEHLNFGPTDSWAEVLRSFVANVDAALTTPFADMNIKDSAAYVRGGYDIAALERGSAGSEGVQYGFFPCIEIETPGSTRFKLDTKMLSGIEEAVRYIDKLKGHPLELNVPGTTAPGWPFSGMSDPIQRLSLRIKMAEVCYNSFNNWQRVRDIIRAATGHAHVWLGFTRFQPSKSFTPIIENVGDSFRITGWLKHGIRIREVYGSTVLQLIAEAHSYKTMSRIKGIRGAKHQGDGVPPWFLDQIRDAHKRGRRLVGTDISAHDKSYAEPYKKALLEAVRTTIPREELQWYDAAVPAFSGLVLRPGRGTPNISHTLEGALPSGSLFTAILGAYTAYVSHYLASKELKRTPEIGNFLNMGDDESGVFDQDYIDALIEVRRKLGFLTSTDEDGVFLRRAIAPNGMRQASVVRLISHEVWPERPYVKGEDPFFAISWQARDDVLRETMDGSYPRHWPSELRTPAIAKDFEAMLAVHKQLRLSNHEEALAAVSELPPAWLESLLAESSHSFMAEKQLAMLPQEVIDAAIRSNWLRRVIDSRQTSGDLYALSTLIRDQL